MQQPLLKSSRGPRFSPKRLYIQGAIFCAAGLLEVFAAVHCGHVFGTAIGISLIAGLLLLSYGACQQELAACPPPRLPHQQPAPQFPAAAMPFVNALGVFTLLLLLVRALSPDPAAAAAFPDACSKLQGCARVALQRPHREGAEVPLKLRASLDDVQRAAVAWVREYPRAEVLFAGVSGEGRRMVHARFVSFLWGFADDFWVQLSCGDDDRTVVEVMGQLRLGVGDLGVNPARNQLLLGAMRAEAAAGKLPSGLCSGGGKGQQ